MDAVLQNVVESQLTLRSLGINVNFSAIAKKGQKAFLASFLTSVLLMCFAAGIAALFF